MTAWLVVVVALGLGSALLLSRAARRRRQSARLLARAEAALDVGHIDEAERILDDYRQRGGRAAHRVARMHAAAAYRAAELRRAERHLDEALSELPRMLPRPQVESAIADARGLRAVLRAARGEADGSRADVAAVRDSERADQQARGRALLAELLLADRDDDADAIKRLSQHGRALMVAGLSRRERALARGLARAAYAAKGGAYRAPAEPAFGEGGELVRWTEALAPRAAPFVRSFPAYAGDVPLSLPEPGRDAREAVEHAHDATVELVRPSIRRRFGFMATWVGLLGALAVVYVLLRLRWALFVLGLGAIVGLMIWQLRRAMEHMGRWRELASIQRSLRSDPQHARRAIESLMAKESGNLMLANAELLLAELAWLEGDLSASQKECDRALARINSVERSDRGRADEADLSVAPALRRNASRLRATLLVSSGRIEEAVAELERDERAIAVQQRVALIAALRRREWDEAARLVMAQPLDLPTSPEDELLAELAILASGRGEEADRQRLEAELEVGDHARFVEVVAPGLLDQARVGGHGPASREPQTAE